MRLWVLNPQVRSRPLPPAGPEGQESASSKNKGDLQNKHKQKQKHASNKQANKHTRQKANKQDKTRQDKTTQQKQGKTNKQSKQIKQNTTQHNKTKQNRQTNKQTIQQKQTQEQSNYTLSNHGSDANRFWKTTVLFPTLSLPKNDGGTTSDANQSAKRRAWQGLLANLGWIVSFGSSSDPILPTQTRPWVSQ